MKIKTTKEWKEVRSYMNKMLKHLGHHCCSIDSDEYNRIMLLTHWLEGVENQK